MAGEKAPLVRWRLTRNNMEALILSTVSLDLVLCYELPKVGAYVPSNCTTPSVTSSSYMLREGGRYHSRYNDAIRPSYNHQVPGILASWR